MILQLGLIFAFLAIGEVIVALTGVPVPSSIIGMLLLAAALKMRIIRLMWVDKVADFLVKTSILLRAGRRRRHALSRTAARPVDADSGRHHSQHLHNNSRNRMDPPDGTPFHFTTSSWHTLN